MNSPKKNWKVIKLKNILAAFFARKGKVVFDTYISMSTIYSMLLLALDNIVRELES